MAARETPLVAAGAPYAPLDLSHPQNDPNVPLSKTQRKELLGEFKGLVYMGLRKVPFERWEGRDMGDCEKPKNAGDRWTLKCEIITGQGAGSYYFYPGETRQTATLQHIDIHVDAADDKLLDEFRRPVQDLFGKASIIQTPAVQAKASGPIRHWNSGQDMAELFIDHSVRPEGSVRFVWMRSPLVAGEQAWLRP